MLTYRSKLSCCVTVRSFYFATTYFLRAGMSYVEMVTGDCQLDFELQFGSSNCQLSPTVCQQAASLNCAVRAGSLAGNSSTELAVETARRIGCPRIFDPSSPVEAFQLDSLFPFVRTRVGSRAQNNYVGVILVPLAESHFRSRVSSCGKSGLAKLAAPTAQFRLHSREETLWAPE